MGMNFADIAAYNAITQRANGAAQATYWQAQAAGQSQQNALAAAQQAFMQQYYAMQSATQLTNDFGWAVGGDWTNLGSIAANRPPTGTPTLATGQAVGSVGYVPGYTGTAASQTQSNLAQMAQTAQGAAGLTGFYTAPRQSQYTPGSFLRIDPTTYDTATYGEVQLDYVLPSGQLQRVSLPQARAMGWNGDVNQITGNQSMIPFSTAAQLESAPPSQLPQQTLDALKTYSGLNSAAVQSAIAQSGVTGLYTAPTTIRAPGENVGGGKFSDLPAETQNAYYYSHGGDWQAAMAAWVKDSEGAIRQAVENAGGTWDPNAPGGDARNRSVAQETLGAQQQYFNQAQNLAEMYGQYYAPGAPGQTGTAGTNMPTAGQQTLGAQQQYWAQAFAQTQANQQNTQKYLELLSNLRGPADWAKYQQVLGSTPGGMRDLYAAAMGQYIPGGGATTGANPEAVSLQSMQGQIAGQGYGGYGNQSGWGGYQGGYQAQPGQPQTAQTGYTQPGSGQVWGSRIGVGQQTTTPDQMQMQGGQWSGADMMSGGSGGTQTWGSGIGVGQQQPTGNQQYQGYGNGTNAWGGQQQQYNLPAPNQISAQSWNNMAPSQKQMLLGMYEANGWDKNDVMALYNQELPRYANNNATAGTWRLQ